MRLIDADALRRAMYHEAFETDSDMQKWDGGCWIRYKMFENAIEAAPTIDPGLDEWCTDCAEYDQEKHSCPRFNRVIRETLEELMHTEKGEKA